MSFTIGNEKVSSSFPLSLDESIGTESISDFSLRFLLKPMLNEMNSISKENTTLTNLN